MASHFAQPVEKNAALYETELQNSKKVPVDVHGYSGAPGVQSFPVSVENSLVNKEIPVVVNGEADSGESTEPEAPAESLDTEYVPSVDEVLAEEDAVQETQSTA